MSLLDELTGGGSADELVEELFDALGIWDSIEDSFGTFDKSYTSGYEYYMGMHLGVCNGPVDEILEIKMDGLTAWKGSARPGEIADCAAGYGLGIPTTQEDADQHALPLNVPDLIPINQEHLFGGEKSRGGALGVVDVLTGVATQGVNPYLQLKCGDRVPAYRGVLSLVFRSDLTSAKEYVYTSFWLGPIGRHIRRAKLSEAPTHHTGFYWGAMQASVKEVTVKVFRSLQGWDGTPVFYPEKATITLDSVKHNNPVHMIYQCLTNRRWGMRRPYALINDANFRLVADQLYAEGFGLSMQWTGKAKIEGFIVAILKHIDGNLYLNPTTGLYELILTRKATDEELAAAPLFTVDHAVADGLGKFNRPGWGEMINDLTIGYLKPDGEKKVSVSDQNAAAIAIQGEVVSESVDYFGIRNEGLAKRVLARDLMAMSTPLATITDLKLNRLQPAAGTAISGAFALHEGALIRLRIPDFKLDDVAFRIVAINFGELTDTTVTITVLEDVYSMPTIAYIGSLTEEWVDPVRASENFPLPNVRYASMSYHTVLQMMGAAGATYLNPEYAAFCVMADAPAAMDQIRGMTVFSADTDSIAAAAQIGPTSQLCPTSLLDGALGIHDGAGNLVNTFKIKGLNALSLVGAIGSWFLVDEEKILCTDVNYDSESVDYLTMTVERGVIDTIPAEHADGAKMWWFNDISGSRTVGNTFLKAEQPYLWVASNSSMDMVALTLATPKLHPTLTADWYAPYPPARVTFEGEMYRESIGASFEMQVSGRNRLTQSNQFLGWDETGTEPETGTSLEVKVFDEDTEALLETVTGIPMLGPEAYYKYEGPSATNIRVEVQTVRGSVKSPQVFKHSAQVCGYGAGYGLFYGGNNRNGVFLTVPGTQYDGTRVFATDKLAAPYSKFGDGRWWDFGGVDASAQGLQQSPGTQFVARVSSRDEEAAIAYHLPVAEGHPSSATFSGVWVAPPAGLTTVETLSYAWPAYKAEVNSTFTTGRYGRVYRPPVGQARASMTQVIPIPDASQDFISSLQGKLHLHFWYGTDLDGTSGADLGRVYAEFLDQDFNILSYNDGGVVDQFDTGWLDAETDALFPQDAYQNSRWRPVDVTVPANPSDGIPVGARYVRLTFLMKNVTSGDCRATFNLIAGRITSMAPLTSDALAVATVSSTSGFPINAELQDIANGWAVMTDGIDGWAASSAGKLKNLALQTAMGAAGSDSVCSSISWSKLYGGSWIVNINDGDFIATLGEVENPELFDSAQTEIYETGVGTGESISANADISWIGQIADRMIAIGVSSDDPTSAVMYKSDKAISDANFSLYHYVLVSDTLPLAYADIRNWVYYPPESKWYVFGVSGDIALGRLVAWKSSDGLTWTKVKVAAASNTAKISYPFLRRTGSSTWAIQIFGGANLYSYNGAWTKTRATLNPILMGRFATAGVSQWRPEDVDLYESDAASWHNSVMLRTGQFEYSANTETGNLGQYYAGATLGFDTLALGQDTTGVKLVSPLNHPYGVKIATCADLNTQLSDAGYLNNGAAADVVGIYGRNTGKRYVEVMVAPLVGASTVTPVIAIGAAVAAGPREKCKAKSSALFTLNGDIFTKGRYSCPGQITLGTTRVASGFRLISGNTVGIKFDFAAKTIRFYVDNLLVATVSGSTVDTVKQWFPVFASVGFQLNTNLGQKAFTYNPNTGGDSGYVGWI